MIVIMVRMKYQERPGGKFQKNKWDYNLLPN